MTRALRVASQPRFAMRREEAAASLSISATKFDEWVRDGRMPSGRRIDGVMLWDVAEVQDYWRALRDGDVTVNPLDRMVL